MDTLPPTTKAIFSWNTEPPSNQNCSNTDSIDLQQVHAELQDRLHHSEYVFKEKVDHNLHTKSNSNGGYEVGLVPAPKYGDSIGDNHMSQTEPDPFCDYWLDLKKFLKDKSLFVGSKGYSPNVAKVKALESGNIFSSEFHQCCAIEHEVRSLQQQSGRNDINNLVLHVTTSAQSFNQQKIDLMWRTLSQYGTDARQFHLVVGPMQITNDGLSKEKTDLENLFECIENQMRAASTMKYGEEIQDSKSEVRKRLILTSAAIKFDVLCTAPGSKVKLDTDTSQGGSGYSDSRPGVFVLYNYARLATLLRRFEDEVKKGTYPGLPAVEAIDFGLLRELQEWKLLFNYILPYPDILTATLGNLLDVRGPSCNLHPQKVCKFLMNLSQDLSIYYSRVHVLVDPVPHLLPTMFARLFLLQAVMQVMKNGLSLLSIEPLVQM